MVINLITGWWLFKLIRDNTQLTTIFSLILNYATHVATFLTHLLVLLAHNELILLQLLLYYLVLPITLISRWFWTWFHRQSKSIYILLSYLDVSRILLRCCLWSSKKKVIHVFVRICWSTKQLTAFEFVSESRVPGLFSHLWIWWNLLL